MVSSNSISVAPAAVDPSYSERGSQS